jgi:hypothetical protein
MLNKMIEYKNHYYYVYAELNSFEWTVYDSSYVYVKSNFCNTENQAYEAAERYINKRNRP